MTRPVTLFTGQWADMPLETLAKKAKNWGYDGLELACWGDHFDVERDFGAVVLGCFHLGLHSGGGSRAELLNSCSVVI